MLTLATGEKPDLGIVWRVEALLPAGYPSPSQDYVIDRIDLNKELIQDPSSSFEFRVSGDSMIGASIHDGDWVVVDRSIRPTSGAIVVAILDGEHMLKRLHVGRSGAELRSENPDYPTFPVGSESELNIFGVVTYVIHPV